MASAVNRLHNFCQALRLPVPVYESSTSGPANQTVHSVKVFINQLQYGCGDASSKNAAKETAATVALTEMHQQYPGYTY
ncbi:hypothetical protein BJ912DRAFT_1061572 [Pholiota molesta]|nr:hypothetical protein BJ912DRAFT_1061572 [Pholiota molesta]